MKPIFLYLASLLVTQTAFSVDKQVTCDGTNCSTIIYSRVGSTLTETAKGASGSFNLGPSAAGNSLEHNLYGHLHIGTSAASVSPTNANNNYRLIGNKKGEIYFSDGGSAEAALMGGIYFDGVNFKYSTANKTGGVVNVASASAGQSAIVFQIGTSTSSAADSTSTLFTAGSVSTAGTWSFGSSTITATQIVGIQTNDSSGTPAMDIRSQDTTADTNNLLLQMVFNGDNDATGAKYIQFADGNDVIGSISANSATTTAYNTSSDRRLKTDIKPMDDGLKKVLALKPSTYKWKSSGQKSSGFIAQDVKLVYPEAVSGSEDDDPREKPMSIDYGKLTPILAAAIQDQQKIIEKLSKRIADLEKKAEE
jgi:hypothetical protein